MDESLRRIDKSITPKLRVIGLRGRVEKFELFALTYNNFHSYQEPHIRKIIQEYLDHGDNYKLTVLFEGNSVYAKTPLLRNLKAIVRANDMSKMNDELYHFFSLSCGSIAHYNRGGWIAEYPTVDALRGFFRRNEYGQDVLSYQRGYDRVEVVKEMCKALNIKLRTEHYSGRLIEKIN
jgi:hypothetical protein